MSVTVARGSAGYSLVEVLFVVGVMAIVTATAVPTIAATMRRYALNNAAQQVAAAIRSARYTAVSKNKHVRVRFNCPVANQFRVVEFTGNSGIDEAGDRCTTSAYPFPDPAAGTLPDVDGPIVEVPVGTVLGDVTDLQISPQGRLQVLSGCPVCVANGNTASIALENGFESQSISIGQNGQVAVARAVSIE